MTSTEPSRLFTFGRASSSLSPRQVSWFFDVWVLKARAAAAAAGVDEALLLGEPGGGPRAARESSAATQHCVSLVAAECLKFIYVNSVEKQAWCGSSRWPLLSDESPDRERPARPVPRGLWDPLGSWRDTASRPVLR